MLLLAIIAPPAMEENLVDWLLIQDEITGFTSQPAHGYGGRHQLSVAEQVSGRRRQIIFWVEVEKVKAMQIIDILKQDYAGAGLHYWLVPLAERGHI